MSGFISHMPLATIWGETLEVNSKGIQNFMMIVLGDVFLLH